MRRTAADFAREAPEDGPFELEVGTGKGKRYVAPKPVTDLTLAETYERGRLNDVWAAASGQIGGLPPRTESGAPQMDPAEFLLRARFGALTSREPTPDDPRAFVPAEKHADYDAFRRDWVEKLPWETVARAMRDCDEHYDPTPGTPEEKASAAAAQILEQATNLLSGGDVDNPRVKELLGQIEAVAEKAGAAAGKSTGAAGV